MFKFRLLQLLLLLLALTSQGSAQFAHTDHKQIVDAAGKPLLLRAINLGNWLVPEGYMWLFQGGPQSPSEIHALEQPHVTLWHQPVAQIYCAKKERFTRGIDDLFVISVCELRARRGNRCEKKKRQR